jgi:hypothetical protein
MLVVAVSQDRTPGWFKHRVKVWGKGTVCAWWSDNVRCMQPAQYKFAMGEGLCREHDMLMYDLLNRAVPCADEKPRIWSPNIERQA